MNWTDWICVFVCVCCIFAGSDVMSVCRKTKDVPVWFRVTVWLLAFCVSVFAWGGISNFYMKRGAIAHASGKVTATRIDHGDSIEWKIEEKK